MAIVTRTIHPLPFEHLEPKRFEDLVRQLAYEFRNWRSLEATGTSGSDDSFDVRGLEIVEPQSEPSTQDDTDEQIDTAPDRTDDRLWLIQCKREKEIGPKKLIKYFEDIPLEQRKSLYGLIVAASCAISKTARDELIEQCREAGIAECYIWSRSEIEDMLFQPKNDRLLFAYFGISLTLQKRKVLSDLRSRLSIKRKLYRALGDSAFGRVLLLDPSESDYPYLDGKKLNEVKWRACFAKNHHPWGLELAVKRFLAYLDDDGIKWDVADAVNDVTWTDPWIQTEEYYALRHELYETWRAFPTQNRAVVTVEAFLKFEDILDIDKEGDPFFSDPIIYVVFENGQPPVGAVATIKSEAVYEDEKCTKVKIESREVDLPDMITNRIQKFPNEFRK